MENLKEETIEVSRERIETEVQLRITPKYITSALRQSNYDTESAISELVDNSKDAQADRIDISIPSKEDLKTGRNPISVYDDGNGMTMEELQKSFSLGSERQYSVDDIGNYGIGMNAAMAYLSQYVVLKTKKEDEDLVSVAVWDIERKPLNISFYTEENKDKSFVKGTRIDMFTKHGNSDRSRLEDFSHTQPAYVTKLFAARYYKAITSKNISPNGEDLPGLSININENPIRPFDPLYRKDKQVKHIEEKACITVHGEEYEISINGYYIGRVEKEGFDKGERNKFSLERQGIYMLLNDKYIQIGGGWLGCRQLHNGLNALRVEMEIPKELIEYFGISMNKNTAVNIEHDSEETSVSRHSEKKKISAAIKRIVSWGDNEAKKDKSAQKVSNTEEENKIAEELSKHINAKSKEAGLKKHSKGIENLPESPKEKREHKGGTKNRRSGLVYNKDIFDISFYEDEKNNSFWKLERSGGKLNIEFNKNHVFYEKFITAENNKLVIELLTAMAKAETEFYDLEGRGVADCEEYWHQVSRWLSKFSKTEE